MRRTALLVTASLALLGASASTKATNASGTVTITGLDSRARHTHGGPAASLGHARFAVLNDGTGPVDIGAAKVELLTGQSCDEPPSEVAAEAAVGGLFTEGMRESAPTVSVGPGRTVEVLVGFEAVPAYAVWCDRFAFRVTFRVDGEPVTAVAETLVTRVEPLR